MSVLEIVEKDKKVFGDKGMNYALKNLETIRKGLSVFDGLHSNPLGIQKSQFLDEMDERKRLKYIKKIREEINQLDRQLERNSSFKKMKKLMSKPNNEALNG